MLKNKIGFEYVGTIDKWNVYLLSAKGLKRLLMVNTEDTEDKAEVPEELICVNDLCERDYNIAKDIVNHLWDGEGDSEYEELKKINWKACGTAPSALEIETFANRFNLQDVFGKAGYVKVTFLSKFNLDNMHFLDDNNSEEGGK